MSVKATNGVRNLFMVDSWSLLVLFSVHVVSKVKLYQIIQENVGREDMNLSALKSSADGGNRDGSKEIFRVVGFRSRFVVDRRLNYFFTTIRVALYSFG